MYHTTTQIQDSPVSQPTMAFSNLDFGVELEWRTAAAELTGWASSC